MKSAEVQQLGILSDLFAESVARCRPASVALLGIAGGNGLEHIDSAVTKRIVGIDVNPVYLEAVRARYSHLPGLELHCLNLAEHVLHLPAVELVHAALVFEHAGVGRCLQNALSLVAPHGVLSVVLQLPSEVEPGVGISPFTSLQSLKSRFSLVDPTWLRETIERQRFRQEHQERRSLAGGKGFWMGRFARE